MIAIDKNPRNINISTVEIVSKCLGRKYCSNKQLQRIIGSDWQNS